MVLDRTEQRTRPGPLARAVLIVGGGDSRTGRVWHHGLAMAGSTSSSKEASPKLAFWSHQAVEYLLGVLIVSQAIQGPSALFPVIAGSLVVLLGATSDGPLAAFKLVPRQYHHWCDLAVTVLLVVGGVLLRDEMNEIGLVFVFGTAVALVALMLRTDYSRKVTRAERRAALAQAADPAAPVSSSPGEQVGRLAGRWTAKGVKAVQAKRK
jgi:hypothetical protein